MSNLLDAIKLLITTESTTYIGYFPSKSIDNICTLYDTGGRSPEHYIGVKKAAYRQPSFQVRIRDLDYSAGFNRCQAIIETLDGLANQSIIGGLILSILLEGDIISLGKDDKNLSEFTINFRTLVQYN